MILAAGLSSWFRAVGGNDRMASRLYYSSAAGDPSIGPA